MVRRPVKPAPAGSHPSGSTAATPRASTPRDRSARWAAHRRQRRADLVEAAIVAVREHGAGVSVAAIAAAAGVTKPVLYRHFTDRADLQRAVSERGAAMLMQDMLPALTTDRAPVARIRAIVDAFLVGAEQDPELWRFVVHNPAGGEAGEDVVAHSIALIASLISTTLVDELRRRGRDAGGAEAWAYGLAGMVYTAGDWWLQHRTMTRDALVGYLTDLIWGGLSGVLGAADGEAGGAPSTREPDGPARRLGELRILGEERRPGVS